MTDNQPDDPISNDADLDVSGSAVDASGVDGSEADGSDALVAALLELERHVGQGGWDQPPRLFALVRTDAVIAAEPQLADQLGLRGTAAGGHPDALTAIEQDHFKPSADLLADLAEIVWPEAVYGCALTMESSFLPADAEADIPDDPQAAAEYVAGHAAQQEMRVVVGVDRGDHRHGVARVRSQPDDLLGAPDLVPGLTEALAHTLAEPDLDDDPDGNPAEGQPGNTAAPGTVQEK